MTAHAKQPSVERVAAAIVLLAVAGPFLFIASTAVRSLGWLIPLAWINGLGGLLASYAVARGWRIGPWAALALVIGAVSWVAFFIPGFLSMFQDLPPSTRPSP